MTEKDDGRIWIKTGGDELTELGRLEYPEGQKPPLQERITEAFTPSLWKDVEKLEKECRNQLISCGYPEPEKLVWYDKNHDWEYSDGEETLEYVQDKFDQGYGAAQGAAFIKKFAKPFSGEWYAARIWDLIWGIKNTSGAPNELLFQRLFDLGSIVTDADWRSTYNSPLKKALMTGFHPLANHNVLKTASPSFETMTTI